jgi:hypothetical protein
MKMNKAGRRHWSEGNLSERRNLWPQRSLRVRRMIWEVTTNELCFRAGMGVGEGSVTGA